MLHFLYLRSIAFNSIFQDFHDEMFSFAQIQAAKVNCQSRSSIKLVAN